MGIFAFFHKIRTYFARSRQATLPYVNCAKQYGNYGEDEFVYTLQRQLPSCKIKRNVIITTYEADAEIDCLVLYEDKIFAIEIKRWKGRLTECENGFLKEKRDRWTGEIHKEFMKSPFKQLGRSIYLLKEQIPVKAWVNAVVFFEDDETESVSTFSDNIWFDNYQDLVEYIRNDGKASFGTGAKDFFEKCVSADFLYANAWGKSKRCIINRATLLFESSQGVIPPNHIASIRIVHHWYYDELFITLLDGSETVVSLENAEIQVNDEGNIRTYALCKLDYIELGKTI